MANADRAADGGRGDDAPLEIPMPLLCACAAIRLEILRDGLFMWSRQGESHARPVVRGWRVPAALPADCVRSPHQPDLRSPMILDYVLGGGLAAILLVYLVIALARP